MGQRRLDPTDPDYVPAPSAPAEPEGDHEPVYDYDGPKHYVPPGEQ